MWGSKGGDVEEVSLAVKSMRQAAKDADAAALTVSWHWRRRRRRMKVGET